MRAFFFSSRRRHTRCLSDWSSDVCSSDLYAYRSSLNRTMVNHLEAKAQMLMRTVDLRPDDVMVDVGSNDGTLLSFFSGRNLSLLGFDPSAERWRGGYPDDSRLTADCLSADLHRS